MAATNNISDLIPKGDLEAIAQLDASMNSSIKTMEGYLGKVLKVNEGLSKSAIAHKELTDQIERYETLVKEVSALQDKQKKIIEDTEKVHKKIIETTSKEAQSMEAARKANESYSKSVQENARVVKESNESAVQTTQTLRDISVRAMEEASKSIDKQRIEYTKFKDELADTRKKMKILDEEYKNGRITQEGYWNLKGKLVRGEQRQSIAVKELGDTIKYNNQIIRTQIGSYDNLSAQYSLLKMQINQMTDAERLNGFTKKELEAQAKSLYTQMSNLQKATGKSQLDVGKYDIAVQDLTRTVSMLDPTVGMLLTKIQNVSGVKAAWIKMNEQLTKSLNISSKAATGLQFGIVGLVVAGIALAIKAYKDWKKEQEETLKRQKELVSYSLASQRNAQQDIATLKLLYDATQNVNKPMKERIRAAKELKDMYPDYLGNLTQEDILAGKAATAYNKLTTAILESARARAISDKITENQGEILKIEDQIAEKEAEMKAAEWKFANADFDQNRLKYKKAEQEMMSTLGKLEKEKENLEKSKKEIEDANAKLAEKVNINNLLDAPENKGGRGSASSKSKGDAEIQALRERVLLQINIEAEGQKKLFENNQVEYQKQLDALNKYEEERAKAIVAARDNQLADLRSKYSSQEAFEAGAKNQIALIHEKANIELTKITEEGDKYRLSLAKDFIENQFKIYSDGLKARNESIDQDETDALSKLAALRSGGVLNHEEYESQKLAITKQYSEERFQAEIDSLRQMLDVSNLTEEQRASIELKIREAEVNRKKDLNKAELDDRVKTIDKIVEAEKEAEALRRDIYQASFDLLMTLSDAYTENALGKLEKESEENDKWRETELERIQAFEEANVITKEQADARKLAVEQQAEAREAEIEEKKKAAKIAQAKREKAAAIVDIAINTATAVMKNNAMMGFVLATPINALTIALGAIQAATVAAQPLPQYRYGTDDHKGGHAIVGDGGKHEMVILPDGSVFKTPNTPVVMDLPKHAVVLPDYEKALINMSMVNHGNENTIVVVENQKQIAAAKEGNLLMKSLVKTQKSVNKNLLRMNNNNSLNTLSKNIW